MIRIQPISKDTTCEKQQAILTTVQKAMGGVPNLISTMAQSPAVANAYLGLQSGAFSRVAPSETARKHLSRSRRSQHLSVLPRRAYHARR